MRHIRWEEGIGEHVYGELTCVVRTFCVIDLTWDDLDQGAEDVGGVIVIRFDSSD